MKTLPLYVGSSPPRRLPWRHCPSHTPHFRPSAGICWIAFSPPPAAAWLYLSASGLHFGAPPAAWDDFRPPAFTLPASGRSFGLRPHFSGLWLETSNLLNGIPLFQFSFDAENCLVFTIDLYKRSYRGQWFLQRGF